MATERRGVLTGLINGWRWNLAGDVTSVRNASVSGTMQFVTIAGQSLRDHDWTPGQHVRVFFKDLTRLGNWISIRDIRGGSRSYTLWDYDPSEGTYTLAVMNHGGDGPGVRWLRTLKAGDSVQLSAPEGTFVLQEDADFHVFLGEETASVAFGAMIRASDQPVNGTIEAAGAEDHLDDDGLRRLPQIERAGASAHNSAALVAAASTLELPAGRGVVYLAGEARTIQTLRQHFVQERGWDRRKILMKPFWTPGRRGMD